MIAFLAVIGAIALILVYSLLICTAIPRLLTNPLEFALFFTAMVVLLLMLIGILLTLYDARNTEWYSIPYRTLN